MPIYLDATVLAYESESVQNGLSPHLDLPMGTANFGETGGNTLQ
jgi:hypothetical protein